MGCINSVPISASINDEIREIQHMTYLEKIVNNDKDS